jgi:hypothetical protein
MELDFTKYNPNQPRDSHGRFASSGASPATEFLASTGETLQQLGAVAHSVSPKTPFWRTSGDLLLRLGGAAASLGTLIVSARSLQRARTRRAAMTHVALIAASLAALHTHVQHFPEEAQAWWQQVRPALVRLHSDMTELKHRIFADRNAGTVTKMAHDIRAMMEERVAL